ncbi:hypothetical protein B0T25DRAFT_518368 [Lasiosphaeria hispida]|uniref:Uncharacterized protein n=1 Tax=Lasiosphaeria hispida TaxID=260671 RepID=A0AAJ0HIE0_9PEZI|nr:hypothetical protein B0T25DRAFT_518368 [Lasiosphaeria hispida]
MQFTTSTGLLAWGLLAQLGSAAAAPEGDSPVLIVVPGTNAGSSPLPTNVIVVPGSGSGGNPALPTAFLTVPGGPAAPQWPSVFLTKGKNNPVFPTWVPRAAIPESCNSVVRGKPKGPSCYTATATTTKCKLNPAPLSRCRPLMLNVTASCPKLKCAAPTNIMCPAYIKLETLEVPCANDCCPNTKTKTVTKACSTCATGCVIPTQTVTQTTGCGVNPTLVPLPTAVLTFIG